MIKLASTWEQAKKAADEILKNKQGWHIAGNVKHYVKGMPAQDYYAQNAKQYYQKLKDLGYENLASNLESKDLNNARKYMETFQTKMGRNAFRPYMYEKGKTYGLSSQDIDNLTSYDADTGEITFAGKNIGRPGGIVDGVSYWDSGTLDNVWNNYVAESGITPPETNMAKQAIYSSNKLLDTLGKDYSGNRDYIMNTGTEQRQRKDDFINSQQNADIFKTNTAKTIMDKFNYMGGIAGGDKLAEGAAANGGNIDSFSAANRARQQLAYTSAGADAVIAEYQNRMNNIMDTLKSIDTQNATEYSALNDNYNLGQGTAQQMSDNAKLIYDNLNQNKLTDAQADSMNVETEARKAEITGQVTPKISDEYNIFLDEKGNVKDLNFDYQARINELEKQLENTTDEGERQSIQLALSWLSRARDKKTALPEYSQYAGTAKAYPWETAGFTLDKASLADAKEIAMEGYKTDKDIATIETAMQEKIQEKKNADNQADRDKAAEMEKWIHENGYSETGFQKWYIEKYGKDDYENTFGSSSDGDEEEEVEVVTMPAQASIDSLSQEEQTFFESIYEEGLTPDEFASLAVNNAGKNNISNDSLSRVLRVVLGFERASEIMGQVEE